MRFLFVFCYYVVLKHKRKVVSMRKYWTLVVSVLLSGVLAGGFVHSQGKACDRACLEGFVVAVPVGGFHEEDV